MLNIIKASNFKVPIRPVRKLHRAQTIEKMHHLKNGFASKSPGKYLHTLSSILIAICKIYGQF
jgi:hypothetical protein